jgi:hypothetical protein
VRFFVALGNSFGLAHCRCQTAKIEALPLIEWGNQHIFINMFAP